MDDKTRIALQECLESTKYFRELSGQETPSYGEIKAAKALEGDKELETLRAENQRLREALEDIEPTLKLGAERLSVTMTL